MLIPINTDAPLYHFPYGTIGLIVINFVCFVATGFGADEDRLTLWMLEYGNGLNPLGWLTSIFAHAGWMHLIGNMFFLWGFGLVVEGKLGLRRFLTLYLVMGMLQSACVDLLTLHRTDDYVLNQVVQEFDVESPAQLRTQLAAELLDLGAGEEPTKEEQAEANEMADEIIRHHVDASKGRCLGASGVIFGLMAISLVWAPKNEMNVIVFIGFRVFNFDLSIMFYSLLYVVLDIIGLMIDQFQMGTSGLHMIGAIVGFGFGTLYLKKGWVDCERWDLFSVLSGKYGRFADDDWALGAHARTDRDYSAIPVPQSEESPDAVPQKTANAAANDITIETEAIRRSSPGNRKLQPINQMIDSGDFIGASTCLFDLRLVDSRSQLDQDRLRTLAVGLLQAEAADEAEIYLEEYIDRFPEDRAWAVTRMAQLLVTERARPNAALALLKTLKKSELDPRQLARAKKIVELCKTQIREGIQDAEQEW